MKLLVLAQTPPPAHGQSLAVAALLEHLRADPEFQVHHVNVPLSRDAADVGRWRAGKILTTVRAGLTARRLLAREGPMPVYYVPAPGKRGALYRDFTLLALARPRAAGLILHWHAVGLGDWLAQHGTTTERRLAQRHLGRADLAIIQADAGRDDALRFEPRRCVVVRNGVVDPVPDFSPRPAMAQPCEVVFVGLGCREKGLFDALEAVRLANATAPGAFRFTAIGPFASAADEAAFRAAAAPLGELVRHAGFVSTDEKNAMLRRADVFCFPSYYPHEGQPAVLLEALAHDLPIVTTRWRGIPENLEVPHVFLVVPQSPAAVAAQLHAARASGPARGTLRAHYLAHFTRERHLAEMSRVLREFAVAGMPPVAANPR